AVLVVIMSEKAVEQLVTEFLQLKGLSDVGVQLALSSDAKPTKDRIVSELLELVDNLKWSELRSKWESLNEQVFSCLGVEQSKLASEFEIDLYKLYLIRCVAKNEKKRCLAFFTEMSSFTEGSKQWSEWMCLPYVAEPRELDPFKRYFSKQWREVFTLSLHNFFNLILNSRSKSLLTLLAERKVEQTSEAISPSSSFSEGFFVEGDINTHELASAMGSIDEELLDEFAVIAQCTGPLKSTSSKQSLKTIIKNISSKRNQSESDK
ncbi:hypothetical protein PFISCL1PPCAC_27683, partial [Pristionchus fissidentatus]